MNEWNLPPSDRVEQIRLVPTELLLIDWILCTGSSLLQMPMDELRDEWHMLRQSVWEAYFANDEELGILFQLSEFQAKTLLTACPTTFAWGDGFDCGFSLKEKLARMLLGTYTDPTFTAKAEAEKKANERVITAAADKLRTTEINLKAAEKGLELSENTRQAKETEAQRLKTDSVRQARETVKVDEAKVKSLKDDLEVAIKEAKEYGITYEDQADNQTESPTPAVSEN